MKNDRIKECLLPFRIARRRAVCPLRNLRSFTLPLGLLFPSQKPRHKNSKLLRPLNPSKQVSTKKVHQVLTGKKTRVHSISTKVPLWCSTTRISSRNSQLPPQNLFQTRNTTFRFWNRQKNCSQQKKIAGEKDGISQRFPFSHT